MCGFDWYWSTNLSAIHWNVTSYLAFTCYNICCWFIKPPYYRIMDNLTLNGELEHTLVLSLVEEIEVVAAIIIVFLVRYLAFWGGFLFIYVSESSFLFDVDYEILEKYCNFQVNLPLLFFFTYQSRLTFIDFLVGEWSLYIWITWPIFIYWPLDLL